MNEISNAFVAQKFNGPLGELTAYVDKETVDIWFLAGDVAISLDYKKADGRA